MAQKLPCKYVHLVCLLGDVQISRDDRSTTEVTPVTDTALVPEPGPNMPHPLVTPALTRPGCSGDMQGVLCQIKELVLRVEHKKDNMSSATWQVLKSHLRKMEQAVDFDGSAEGSRARTALPPSSNTRSSTSHIQQKPTFTSTRRRREAPTRGSGAVRGKGGTTGCTHPGVWGGWAREALHDP